MSDQATVKLTVDQIKQIPELKAQGLNRRQIGEKLNVHWNTIKYWETRLKRAGYDVPKSKMGREAIKL